MGSTEIVPASALVSLSLALVLRAVALCGSARAQTRFSVPDGCGS